MYQKLKKKKPNKIQNYGMYMHVLLTKINF